MPNPIPAVSIVVNPTAASGIPWAELLSVFMFEQSSRNRRQNGGTGLGWRFTRDCMPTVVKYLRPINPLGGASLTVVLPGSQARD